MVNEENYELWIARVVFACSAGALVSCGWVGVGQSLTAPLLMVFIFTAVWLAFRDTSQLLMSLLFLAPVGPEYSLATLHGGSVRIQSSGYANVFSISVALYDFLIAALAIAWLVRCWRKEVPRVLPSPLRWAFAYVAWIAISLAYAAAFITSTSQILVQDPILGFQYSFALGPAQMAVAVLNAIKLAEVMFVGVLAAALFRSTRSVADVSAHLILAGLLVASVGTIHTVLVQNELPALRWPSVRLDDGVFLFMAIGAALLLIGNKGWLWRRTFSYLGSLLVMAFFVSLMGKRGAALGLFGIALSTLAFAWKSPMAAVGSALVIALLLVNPAPFAARVLDTAATVAEWTSGPNHSENAWRSRVARKETLLNPLLHRSLQGPKSDFGEGIGWSHSGAYTISEDHILNRINRKIGLDYSIKHRVIQQLRAFEFFREHMITGVGFHTSVYRGIGITDNQLMSTAVETGAIGVLLVAGVAWSLCALAWRGTKGGKPEAVFFGKLLFTTIIGLFAVSLSVEVLYLYRAMVSFWLIVGIAWCVIEGHASDACIHTPEGGL